MVKRGLLLFKTRHPFVPTTVEYDFRDDRTTRKWSQHPLLRTVQEPQSRRSLAWCLRRVDTLERLIKRRERRYASWLSTLSPFNHWLVAKVFPVVDKVLARLR